MVAAKFKTLQVSPEVHAEISEMAKSTGMSVKNFLKKSLPVMRRNLGEICKPEKLQPTGTS